MPSNKARIAPSEFFENSPRVIAAHPESVPVNDSSKKIVIGGSLQDPQTKLDIVNLCITNEFYVDNIRGLLASNGVTGIIYRSDDTCRKVIGFVLFNVDDHMPVAGHQACVLHIHYALVAQGQQRNNLGTMLLDFALQEAAMKFPGCRILAEVESKPTEGARNFWFTKQNFQTDQGNVPVESEAPVLGIKTIEPSHLWQELGKIKAEEGNGDNFGKVWSLLYGDGYDD